MALTTRCPHCGTAFKVVPDQLKVRDGLVRCGMCSRVFDGRATLVSEIPTLHVEPPGSYASSPYPSAATSSASASASTAAAALLAPSAAAPTSSISSAASVDAAWERTAVAQPSWPAPAAPGIAAPAPAVGRRSEPSLASGGTPPRDTATGAYGSAMPASSSASTSQGAPEVLRGRHHALRRADPGLRARLRAEFTSRSAALYQNEATVIELADFLRAETRAG